MKLVYDIFKILCTAVYGLGRHYAGRLIFSKTPKSLDSDVALVTGASMGLGRQIVLDLSKHCSKFILADINKHELDVLVDDLKALRSNIQVYALECDVSDTSMIDSMITFAREKFGRITLLISNAGIVRGKFLMNQTDGDFEKVIRVNLVSHFYLLRRLLPDMLGCDLNKYPGLEGEPIELRNKDLCPRGHIVMVNSIAGHFSTPGLSEYSASKAGAVMLCESLRNELRVGNLHDKILTTNVMPYFINTGMFDGVNVKNLNSFLPINSVEESSMAIVNGILNETADIFIPRRIGLIPFFQSFLPSPVMDRIKDMIDIAHLMRNFRGH